MITGKKQLASAILGLGLLLLLPRSWAQGFLTPPGTPAPTMRTLLQVEPRTPVQTLSGLNGQCQYLVNKPGSYYLTGNITGVKGLEGIRITTDSVTIDLNGFSLIGVAGTQMGVNSQAKRTVLRNGTICLWVPTALYLGDHARLESLNVEQNSYTGIAVGAGCLIRDCIVEKNSFHGLQVMAGTIVKDCIIEGNTQYGVYIYGSGGQIHQCTIQGNRYGISATTGGDWMIANNVVCSNQYNGIEVKPGSMVMSNLVSGSGSYIGISANDMSRVEGNHVTGFATGIEGNILADGNVVINNSCLYNATNYHGISNNNWNTYSFGPLSTTKAATNPFSNISIP